ncbi:MAG: L-methionine (R)-S-oxide reductase [Lentisphaeria bacterium]|jgi:L-methionine (R)-S-oxide reductase
MAEYLNINGASKIEQCQILITQISALICNEEDTIANLANTAAALKQTFGFFWMGFCRVCGVKLVLGPFQGPIACTRIGFGSGGCGTAWGKNKHPC